MGLVHSPSIIRNSLVFHIDGRVATNNSIVSFANTSLVGNLANKTSNVILSSNNLGVFTFNGSTDYLDFGAVDLGIEAANKTMCAWIYVTGYPGGLAPIVDRDEESAGYGFWMSTGGKLWYWPGTNIDIIDDGPYSVSLNTWTHVAISFNVSNKEGKFYYNGQLSSTKTASSADTTPSSTNRLCIGAVRNRGEIGSFGNATFQGYIGPVSLYNKILSLEEIQQNFNTTRRRFSI